MTSNVSRRRFLELSAGAAAASVAAGVATNPSAARGQGDLDCNVAIIGAGLAGLVAARELDKAGIKDFVVLEARDRVGGRTVNHDIGHGAVAEGGGQWVGPTQTAILDLCRELGIGTFPTYLDGEVTLLLGGRRMTIPYGMSETGESAMSRKIDALARTVPLNAPWKAERADEWDSMSLAEWAAANKIRGEDRESLDQAASLTLSTTADRLSFLYFLFYVHSAGSLHDLESMKGGAQDSRIEGGSQILSLEIAKTLGDRLRLNSPVLSIVHDADSVTIRTSEGAIRAGETIVALMPSLADRIEFDPPLPKARRELQRLWVSRDDSIKFNVVYERPFWREAGLSGMGIADAGPIQFTTDNSPSDGSLGVILVLSSSAAFSSDPSARQSEVLRALADFFGDEAKNAIGFHEVDWGADPYTGGCVSPLAPGILTHYGASLRPSVGRVHWSGTETAEIWTGYMDGAVRAGGDAAKKIIAGASSNSV